MINRTNPGEVALYRFLNERGELLYIGICDEPAKRWYSHADKAWWPNVATYEVTWYSSRKEAAEAERESIIAEHPEHNVVYNSTPYQGDRFPSMNLHPLACEHFGDQPFSCRDLEEQLGIPYGTAVVYSARLVQEGAFKKAGKRRLGPRRVHNLFVAVPSDY
jgi:predicted GIY-YIG superfamily endonuclease